VFDPQTREVKQIPQRILKLLRGEAPVERAAGLGDTRGIGGVKPRIEEPEYVGVLFFRGALAARLWRHFSCGDAVMRVRPDPEKLGRLEPERKRLEV
jgi:hypothetical protein